MSECAGEGCDHSSHAKKRGALGFLKDFFRVGGGPIEESAPEVEVPAKKLDATPSEIRQTALRFAKDFAMLRKSKHAGGRARYLGIGLTKRVRKADKRRARALRRHQRAQRRANRAA